jgi:hypothetical protein
MFTPGGQIDLLSFAGVRGGGGKGGGQQGPDPRFVSHTVVDPVSGRAFSSSPFGVASGQKSAEDQLNEEITQRQAQEKATSDAATAQAATDAQTKETTFQGNRQTAYNDALQNVMRTFQLQGLDPNQYMATDIQPALQRQFNSVQDLDPNPAGAFPTSLGDTILGNVTSGRRTSATNALNQVFTPNFTNNLLPDSTTGGFIDDILNEQFNPLTQQLTNAQNRNTLNPVGFQGALDALNAKKTAARSTIQNLGQGILDTDRSGINDIISGARTTASGLSAGQSFDPSEFAGQATSRAQTDLTNFGGALRNAVGATKFADINDLLNAGGAVQGPVNPNAAPGGVGGAGTNALDPAAEEAKRQRGLGNTGAF